MAVAYVPAYLEDYSVYKKDYANGLYGPAQFLLCNFLIGIPYLCSCQLDISLLDFDKANDAV